MIQEKPDGWPVAIHPAHRLASIAFSVTGIPEKMTQIKLNMKEVHVKQKELSMT
jgi:hypothetical protein